MTQSFDDWQWNHGDSLQSSEVSKVKKAYLAGAASRQAEIDKIKSDNQLSESQIGQACVKWKEIAEKRQAEIDELKVMIRKLVDNTIIGFDDELENQANDLLKGESK